MSEPSHINPMYFVIGLSVLSMLINALISFHSSRRGTEVALARFEERQNYQGEDLKRVRNEQDEHADLISDHDKRLSVLEHAIDRRGQPRDYVPG